MVDVTGFVVALVLNAAIALVGLSLFVALRPHYAWCFETRRNPKRRGIGLEPPLIPPGALGWFSRTMGMSDEQVMDTAGLDAVMLIKFFEVCTQFFLVLTVFGIGVLLPINFTAGGSESDPFAELSMSNIPQGSDRFWAHLVVAYVMSGFFYWFAYQMWKSFLNLHHTFLARSIRVGGQHSILVHNVPQELRTDQALYAHFHRLFPGEVRSARMAKDMSLKQESHGQYETLVDAVVERDNVVATLERNVATLRKDLSSSKSSAAAKRPQQALTCFCCNKVDAIDHNHAELERLNQLIQQKQTQMLSKRAPTLPSGFVTFYSAKTAVAALHYVYDTTPYSMEVKVAPELRDVYWPALRFTQQERSIRTFIVSVVTALLIVFWMVPVGFIMGVANLRGLAGKWSWLSGINDIPNVILGFIEGYLPVLVLLVFFALLPKILLAFSKAQGIEASSWLQKSVINKYFLFMVINFFFGPIIGTAIFGDPAALFNNLSNVPTVLGMEIPKAASYFVNYVGLAAFAGFPLQIAQIARLIVGGLKKKYMAVTARDYEIAEAPPMLDYAVTYCPHLLIFLITVTYACIAPIILPFAACYFLLGWVVFKLQLVYVYVQPFECGGRLWPTVYNKMSTSLIIAQICMIGILGLKVVPGPAVVVIPLPFITLAFERYIRNAIKPKIHSLPLDQINELDAERAAMRPKTKGQVTDALEEGEPAGNAGEAGSSSSSSSSEKEETVGGSSEVETVRRDRADSLSSRERRVSTSAVGFTVVTTAAEPRVNNGDINSTSSYLMDTDDRPLLKTLGGVKQESRMPHGPHSSHALAGFPYTDSEQKRECMEGDVAAYVQPELMLIPANIIVQGAEELTTTASADPHDRPRQGRGGDALLPPATSKGNVQSAEQQV